MFKDENEKNFFYYIAKEIAEIIAIQLDKIDEFDGANHFDIDFSQITLNSERNCIEIETEYIETDDGTRYGLHDELNMYKSNPDFFPKIFYMWLDCFADDFKHGVNFSGHI